MIVTLGQIAMTAVRDALELYLATESAHFVNLRAAGETTSLDPIRARIVEAQRLLTEIKREQEWPTRKAAYDKLQAADGAQP